MWLVLANVYLVPVVIPSQFGVNGVVLVNTM
jgi:hypothetical protein